MSTTKHTIQSQGQTPPEDNIDSLLGLAHWASDSFREYTSSQVENIAKAVSSAALAKAADYAQWSVKETGFGNAPDKTIKNQVNATAQLEQFDFQEYNGVKVDAEKKIARYAKPAGVIVALIPSTNPIATIYYKVMSALLTRNVVILCPHPGAKECCVDAADYLADAAEKAGAPAGCIQTLRHPSVAKVSQLMSSPKTDLILATGGPAMVRAAYGSGNPAIGVGPGNVACFVDKSADLALASESIVTSKAFDNSLLCTCESVVIAHQDIADQLVMQMVAKGAYHVEGRELELLRAFLYPENKLNPEAIGKSAVTIAKLAGFSVPSSTKVLGMEIFQINPDEPFSKEKMFPVLALLKVSGCQQGLNAANAMLRIQGKGHSLVIHSQDNPQIARWSKSVPVCRITINGPGVFGASGFATNLPPSPVIGTGYFGRSSVSENIFAKHLVQWTQVAWNKDLTVNMASVEQSTTNSVTEIVTQYIETRGATGFGPAGSRENSSSRSSTHYSASSVTEQPDDLRAMIKALVEQELKQILEQR